MFTTFVSSFIALRRDKLVSRLYEPIKCVIAQKFTFTMWILNYTV